ncbi:MAG: HAD family hydrolase [Ilumatobacteraceae bacterium]|mgnify:FL=1|nr:HAD family hydrolase [Ilumatobacteraceae bacterium]MBP7888613.1 HAD family hydrolase [Ilumatobacteraceae bacterium]MBP8211397.1 HAD family hydrolase [Ilumatobacteraceae bacterium]HQY14029.1 HAD family hydrolase [Ilumatobacteraceae bacterium]HQY83772.1 HAD family hydrolase [Ilumatobacteraceae bacterium]
MPDLRVTHPVVKAVIFDVDGTLYRQRPLRRAMAVRLVAGHLLHPIRGMRTARILAAYRQAQEDMRADAAVGDLTEVQLLAASARTGVDLAEVARCVTRWMDVAPLALLPRCAEHDLVESLDLLRSWGLRLAVLSDYPAHAKLAALGIADHFDHVLCAQDADIGRFKPHPRGLEVALQRLELDAAEVLYVGDRSEVDAVSAAAANIRCVIVGGPRVRTDGTDYHTTRTLREMTMMLEPT